jgi:hypothetical protein
MKAKVILIILSVILLLAQTYVLDDLIQKLNGYEKKWVSGINTKFVDMNLLDTMSMMGTKLPIKPEDRLPER